MPIEEVAGTDNEAIDAGKAKYFGLSAAKALRSGRRHGHSPVGLSHVAAREQLREELRDRPTIDRDRSHEGCRGVAARVGGAPWLGQHVVPIPDSQNLRRVEEKIASADPELTDADVEAIDAAIGDDPFGSRNPEGTTWD